MLNTCISRNLIAFINGKFMTRNPVKTVSEWKQRLMPKQPLANKTKRGEK